MLATILAIVSYVLGSLGFYTIASRRGIHHAWLAWVPIGNLWLIGCISDQYQALSKGKVKNKRKLMLGLGIVYGLCIILVVVACVALFIQMFAMGGMLFDEALLYDDFYMDYYEEFYTQEFPAELLGLAAGMGAACLVLCLVAIPLMIVQYIALYDVFASCDPDNAVLFLLLSIFLGISAFLVFICKDKDRGMPPPKPLVYYDPAMYNGYQQPPAEFPKHEE